MLYSFLLFAQEKGGQAQPDGLPPWAPFVPLIIIFALFYFLLILPERRRERQRVQNLFSNLKKNDRVVTNAGIIAVVVNIRDEEVDLRIDKETNARMTVVKSTIARILIPEDQKEAAGTNVKAGAPPAGK